MADQSSPATSSPRIFRWSRTGFLGILERCRLFLVAAYHGVIDANLPRMGASLAYTSLLAIVPLASIALAMLAAFPAFDGVRSEIIEQVVTAIFPYQQEQIQTYVEGFIAAAAGLTALGVVGLGVTAVLLLITIESAFNTIFEVRAARNPLARALMYWALITVGPLLLGASFSLSGQLSAVRQWAGEGSLVAPVTGLVPALGPELLTIVFLTLLYLLVPNRPVRLIDALIGALVASVLAHLLQKGFVLYLTSARSYETIYGALAILPIFLIWTYLSWLVVLMGAVTAARLQEWIHARPGNTSVRTLDHDRLRLAVSILEAIHKRFTRNPIAGKRAMGISRRRLRKDLAVPDLALIPCLETLEAAGLIGRSGQGPWLPAQSFDRVTLHDVVRAMNLGLPVPDHTAVEREEPDGATHTRLSRAVQAAVQAEQTCLNVTLADLFDGSESKSLGAPVSEPRSVPEGRTAVG